MRRCGKDFRVYAFTGSPATWKLVGSKSDAVSITSETVSVTDKDQAAWQASLDGCGIVSASVTIQGVVSDSAVFRELQQLAFLRQSVALKLVSGPSSEVWLIIHGRLEKIERTGTFNDAEGFSLFLSGNGAPGTAVRIAAVAPMPFASLTALCKTPIQVAAVAPMPFASLTAEQAPPPEWYLMPYFRGFAMTSADMNSDGSIIYIMRANAKIYKSVDFGESWTEKNLGDDAWNGSTIKCDSTGNHVVFLHAASLGNPTRFWESVNAGVDWSYEDLSIEATDICMARDGSVIYVIHPSGLKKKTGGVWSTVTLPAGMSGLTPWRICCSADGAKVLIAGSKAYNSHEIWELISGTWTQVFTTTDVYYYFRDIKMAQDGSIAMVTSAKTTGSYAVKNRARRGAHPTAWTDESIPMYGTYPPTYGVPSRLAITADGSVAFAVSRYNIAKLSSGTWENGRGDDLPEDPYEWPYYWTGVTCSDDGSIVVAYTYGHISDPWDCAWIYK